MESLTTVVIGVDLDGGMDAAGGRPANQKRAVEAFADQLAGSDHHLNPAGLHGRGQFWCFTCHDLEGNGGLKTLEGEPLAFSEAYFLCSQCHVDQARDWAYGAHGKRVGTWQGERVVYNCTACHYQHNPAIKPREAVPPPPVRRDR